MKVLVTGACGRLGREVVLRAAGEGNTVTGTWFRNPPAEPDAGPSTEYCRMDITDRAAVRHVLETVRPDCVIHCAGWTDVDAAEKVGNRNEVSSVNVLGTQAVAETAGAIGAKMIYLSSDYIFGPGIGPRKPEDDCSKPLNEYGRSKRDGETAVCRTLEKFFIVRTEWLFGPHGNSFVKAVLEAGRKQDTVRVVNDQIGTPTYIPDLAVLLLEIAGSEKYGYYHAVNEGPFISRSTLAVELFRQAGLKTKVQPVTTEEYGRPGAARPRNSCLDTSALKEAGFHLLPDWRDAMGRFLLEAGKEKECR